MASLWKNPRSSFWFACFRSEDGKRRKVSTGSVDRDEAQRIADRFELEARESMARVPKPSVDRVSMSAAVVKAIRLAESGKLDPFAVRDFANELLVATGQQPHQEWTIRKWFETWRKSRLAAVGERSAKKYEQVSRDFLEWCGSKADGTLEGITKGDAVSFRDSLRSAGLSPNTVNQTVKLVRGVLAEAVDQGYLGRNPFTGVARVKADHDASREPFTLAEVEQLVQSAEDDWKGLILLASTTGLRLLDAARLRWVDVDLKEGRIRVRTRKTGTLVEPPLHDAFREWLEQQTRGIGKAPVFPALAAKSGAGKSGLSSQFRRIMTEAGIAAGTARMGAKRGRTVARKSFHSLRHFISSQMAAAGVRSEIARQITGHADAGTHAGYVRADDDTLRAAINSIKLGSL